MKKYILILVAIITLSLSAEAQSKTTKATFQVDGVCKMCKERIEKAALLTKGVKFASWNVDTKELYCIFNNKKTSETEIKKSLAAAGHDTKEFKASDETYNSLEVCCRYRDGEVTKHD